MDNIEAIGTIDTFRLCAIRGALKNDPKSPFAANAVRLQLHALAYNLGNFLHTLATPAPIKDWSLTTRVEHSCAMSSSRTTMGEVRLDDRQFRGLAGREAGSGRPFAIPCCGGALRDSAALSKASIRVSLSLKQRLSDEFRFDRRSQFSSTLEF